MKKLFYLFVVCLLSISCKKQIEIPNDVPIKSSFVPDSLNRHLNYLMQRTGANRDNIKYLASDSSFIVEGDIVIFKKDIDIALSFQPKRSTPTSPIQQRQFLTSGNPATVSDIYITNLKIRINVTSADWYSATEAAIVNYNLASLRTITKIKLTIVPEGQQDVAVYETGQINENPNVIADAQLPSYAGIFSNTMKPGALVRIYNNHSSLPLEQKILAITHELGHIIGLAHTNTSDGVQINGTATSDINSFMHNSLIQPSFNGFTNNDLIALRTLYPKTIGSWDFDYGSAQGYATGPFGSMYYFGRPPGDTNGVLVYYNQFDQTHNILWDYSGQKIATGYGNDFYYINSAHQIFSVVSSGSAPIQMPDAALEIATNNIGVYIISTTPAPTGGNIIKRWNGVNWIPISSDIGAIKFATCSNSEIAYIDNSGFFHILREDGNIFNFSQNLIFQELAANRSLGFSGNLFALGGTVDANGDYELFRWTGYDWYDVGFRGFKIGVDAYGHPWVAKNNGENFKNLTL